MKKMIKLMAVFMAVCSLLCVFQLPINVAAASNECVLVKGDGDDHDRWITFIVKTDKKKTGKIVFNQTKGLMRYAEGSGKSNKIYGAYTIKVTNQKTGETKQYYWKYKSSYTLKLEKNTTYSIQVKAYKPATVGDQKIGSKNIDSFIYRIIGWLFTRDSKSVYNKQYWQWDKVPTWKVKSTSGIDWCVFKG